jgi:hypothetical protein
MIKKLTALVLMLLVLGSAVSAQSSVRRIMVFIEAAGATLGPADLRLLHESAVAAFGEEEGFAILEPANVLEPRAGRSEKSRVAWAGGADSWIAINASGRLESLAASFEGFDMLSGRIILDLEKTDVDVVARPRALWSEVVRLTAAALSRPVDGTAPASTVVTIQAVAGTSISGLAEEPVIVDADGTATANVPIGSSLRITATRNGYRVAAQTIYAHEDSLLVEIRQDPLARWAAELSMNKLAYPGAFVSFMPLAERVFVRLGLVSFAWGLPLWGESDPADAPLNQVVLLAGAYLEPVGKPLRLYAGAGSFLRLSSHDGGIALEEQSAWGFFPLLGVEWQINLRFGFFLEHAPLFFVLKDPDTIREYYSERARLEGSSTPYLWFGDLLADFASFTVGGRFYLRLRPGS